MKETQVAAYKTLRVTVVHENKAEIEEEDDEGVAGPSGRYSVIIN